MKMLSQAGRLVLICSVAVALPTYTVANYLVPKSIYYKLNSLMMRFQWSFSDNQHRLCLKSWASLCRPKKDVGLGLKLTEDRNKAPIANMGWQIQTNPEKLWVQIICAKYLKSKIVWDAQASVGASQFWKGITRVVHILKGAACFQIGSGTQVRVWHDPWLPYPALTAPRCELIPLSQMRRPRLTPSFYLFLDHGIFL